MKTFVFEMTNQDFSQWDVNAKGIVVDCRPCQAWVWCGARVLFDPKVGDKPVILPKGAKKNEWSKAVVLQHRILEIRYTCDVCKQGGFSERGLKAHQGTQACKRREKQLPKPKRGVCKKCGCTFDNPCISMVNGSSCSWADRSHTLCSFCVGR